MSKRGFFDVDPDKVAKGDPPSDEVEWTVVHRDGRVQKVTAQTAYMAVVRGCKWTFQEIIECSREG